MNPVGNLEIHVSLSERTIKGCLILIWNERIEKIDFKCSSAIEVRSLTVNGTSAFYTRNPDASENIRVFIPELTKLGMWSAVPTFARQAPSFKLVITWSASKSPSIIHFPNFIGASNIPYGTAGWMPEPYEWGMGCIKSMRIKTDSPRATVLGPNKGIRISDVCYEYRFNESAKCSWCSSWAVGELSEVSVHGIQFFSIGQFVSSQFSFVREMEPLLEKEDVPPFLVVPSHGCELEVTTGFFLLSAELLSDSHQFPSIFPIPHEYHVVAAVSFALAYDRYGRRFSESGDMNWLLFGLIMYASMPYVTAVIGETGTAVFQWIMFRYTLNYGDGIGTKDVRSFLINRWVVCNPMRMRALFAVHALTVFVSEAFRAPDKFIMLWPNKISNIEFHRILQRYTMNPKNYIDGFVRCTSYPMIRMQAYGEKDSTLKTRLNVSVTLSSRYYDDDKMSASIEFPLSVRVFHQRGSLARTVSARMKGDTTVVFEYQCTRKRHNADGIHYALIENDVQLPISIVYTGTNAEHMCISLINMHDTSPWAQHEALASIQRLLFKDYASDDLMPFLRSLIGDETVRDSIKCHVFSIFRYLLQNINHSHYGEVRRAVQEYVCTVILDTEKMELRNLSLIDQTVLISALQAMACIRNIAADLSTYTALKLIFTQVSSHEIAPSILLCFKDIDADGTERREIIEMGIEYMTTNSGNTALMTAAIDIFMHYVDSKNIMLNERLCSSFITSLSDRLLAGETRVAIARLLLARFKMSVMKVLQSLVREIQIETPQYYFVTRVLNMMLADNLTLVRNKEIYGSLHMIAQRAANSDSDLEFSVSSLLERMWNEWPYVQVPDGIIRAQPMEEALNTMTLGMHSDDD